MKEILQYLFEHKTLSRVNAKKVLMDVSAGIYNEQEVTAFITVFLMRSITLEELQGFRDALLELKVNVSVPQLNTIDIVGTGGDGKNSFNISTLSCFVVAGAGHYVTKHGNYGASAISGASNVMEQLGYKFSNDTEKLATEVEQAGICFLHAPLFHPALKSVAPIRKNLGLRTFFNMLGPLVNPANPSFQLIGVYNLEMARLYTYLLQAESKQFSIVHSLDGYDEISLTADTKVISNSGEQIYSATELGGIQVLPTDIIGGDTKEDAAKLFYKIISGEGTAQQNAVVCANAAMAIYGAGTYANYADSLAQAKESLQSGKAFDRFKKLISVQ
jgi:anthranilate phosphoribosyltransferase